MTGGSDLQRVMVELGERSYSVIIGGGALGQLREVHALAGMHPRSTRAAMIIADSGVPEAFQRRAAQALAAAGVQVHTCIITPSEETKTFDTLQRILLAISESRLERGDLLVALGGGIVGDVAGFAAATYRRGIAWIQCPTTLLAMADASIGGKTGVNLPIGGELRKNMVGAFHQPRLVLADLDVLASLPDRHYRAALAECLKHGIIGAEGGDPDLFGWMLHHCQPILERDSPALATLIARNVALKARIVAADEREQAPHGGRALLNLGHTFAHALEGIPALHASSDSIQHGEAVALGLVAAAATAAAAGLAIPETADLIRAAVAQFGLPTRIRGIPANADFRRLMLHDKKTVGGKLRLVLPTELGSAQVCSDVPDAAVDAGIDSIRDT